MHFNPKVAFTKIIMPRDPQTGIRKHQGVPWDINFEKIESYTHGEIRLDDGEVIYVEEDYEQIKKIIDDKIAEHERYNTNLRLQENNGMVFIPEDE